MIILITFRERQYAMGMEVELVLLAALIVIFVISFCALLQKIRKTYENDRELTERVTSVSSQQLSLTEIYINPTFTSENENGGNNNSQGVFPCAPPPYTETYCEPPPKYEDIVKSENFRPPPSPVQESTN